MARGISEAAAIQWVAYFLGQPDATIESVTQRFDVRFPGMPAEMRRVALSEGRILYGQAQEATTGQGNLPIGHYFGYPPEGQAIEVRVRFRRGPTAGSDANWITQTASFFPGTTQEDVVASLAEKARGVIRESDPTVGLAKTGSDWSQLLTADTESGYIFEFLPTVQR